MFGLDLYIGLDFRGPQSYVVKYGPYVVTGVRIPIKHWNWENPFLQRL